MKMDAIRHGFSVAMFMNVHEIVHDPFLAAVKVVNPVIALCLTSLNFSVSEIFVNNWAILFLFVFLCIALNVVSHWFCGVGGCGLFLGCS